MGSQGIYRLGGGIIWGWWFIGVTHSPLKYIYLMSNGCVHCAERRNGALQCPRKSISYAAKSNILRSGSSSALRSLQISLRYSAWGYCISSARVKAGFQIRLFFITQKSPWRGVRDPSGGGGLNSSDAFWHGLVFRSVLLRMFS